MAANKKTNIMQHLALSGATNYEVKRSAQKESETFKPEPQGQLQSQTVQAENSKRDIMSHLATSTGKSVSLTTDNNRRQGKIMEHIRMTRG